MVHRIGQGQFEHSLDTFFEKYVLQIKRYDTDHSHLVWTFDYQTTTCLVDVLSLEVVPKCGSTGDISL